MYLVAMATMILTSNYIFLPFIIIEYHGVKVVWQDCR